MGGAVRSACFALALCSGCGRGDSAGEPASHAPCLPFVVYCGECPSGCVQPEQMDMGGTATVRRAGGRSVRVKQDQGCDVTGVCGPVWREVPRTPSCYGICDRQNARMPLCVVRAGECVTNQARSPAEAFLRE